jgi:hypothetical protein
MSNAEHDEENPGAEELLAKLHHLRFLRLKFHGHIVVLEPFPRLVCRALTELEVNGYLPKGTKVAYADAFGSLPALEELTWGLTGAQLTVKGSGVGFLPKLRKLTASACHPSLWTALAACG